MEIVKPKSVGFNGKRLKRIDSAMMRFVDAGKVAGIATRVLRHGKLVQAGGYGLASTQPERKMQPDTLFRIWSMSKVVTSVAAMMLYEQGHFVLDTDIVNFLPEFKDTPVYVSGEGDQIVTEPRKSTMTIRQFMLHTCGLAAGVNAAHPVGQLLNQKMQAIGLQSNLEAIVKGIADVPLIYQPNTRWNYSNGLEVMARLVEVITGRRFQDYVKEEIFHPLGMVDSSHVVRDDHFERFGALYQWDKNGNLTQVEAPSQSLEYQYRLIESDNTWWARGGSGMISTAPDYARFAQMLLKGGELDGVRILAPRTVALITTNHLTDDLLPYNFPDAPPKLGYGHGLGVHTMMDHGLAGLPCTNSEYWKDGGAGTLFWVDPDLDLIGIVMYQLLDFWQVPVFDTFRASVYQALDC